MAGRELTADDKDRLDRLLVVLAEFAKLNERMDLPMMRVLTTVCRREGAGPKELPSHLPGYAGSVTTRLALDMGTDQRFGRGGEPPLGLMEYSGDDTDRQIALTPKGIEFRDRLLAMLTPG
jgi:hypothetical protein